MALNAEHDGALANGLAVRRQCADYSTKIKVIAQVVGRFGGGGAQRLAHNLALGLAADQVAVCCIAVRTLGEYASSTDGMPMTGLGARGILGTLHAAARLRRLVRQKPIGCLHIHGAGCLPFCALAMIGMRGQPRMIFTWHDSEGVLNTKGLKGWLMRWAVRRCDVIFGASRSIVDRMRARLGESLRIEVFRNGVPVVAPTTGMWADEPVICWCGRIVPSKDPQALIRAAAALKREGLRFRVVLAGDAPAHLGWFMDETRALAAELGVADIVEFPGWVSDVAALCGRSAIGVQTSYTEGLSMTLLEQMMAGLAVVATDVGDTSVAVEDGKGGYVVPVKDDIALVDRLRVLLEARQHRAQMGAAARQRAVAEFSLASMARQAREAYERIEVQRKHADETQPPAQGQQVAGRQG